jgi:hypothetical protein
MNFQLLLISIYFLIDFCECAGFFCCDSLNNKTSSKDCACSNLAGGVGTCSCSSSPNTRQGWLCKKDANGDSVSSNLKNKP